MKAGVQRKLVYTALSSSRKNAITMLARMGQECGVHRRFSLPMQQELPDLHLLLPTAPGWRAAPWLFPKREMRAFQLGCLTFPPGPK